MWPDIKLWYIFSCLKLALNFISRKFYQFWKHLGDSSNINCVIFIHLNLFFISGGNSKTMYRVAYIKISLCFWELTFLYVGDTSLILTIYRVFPSVNNFYWKISNLLIYSFTYLPFLFMTAYFLCILFMLSISLIFSIQTLNISNSHTDYNIDFSQNEHVFCCLVWYPTMYYLIAWMI